VLAYGYPFDKGKLIVREMTDALALDMVDKGLSTPSITLQLSYSGDGKDPHGTESVDYPTSSTKRLLQMADKLYDRIAYRDKLLRKVSLTFNNVTDEAFQQYDIFTDPVVLEKERSLQKAVLSIKKKYGKNAILKGMDLEEGSTTKERNEQIGGHKA
jgi:DNA polymerase V